MTMQVFEYGETPFASDSTVDLRRTNDFLAALLGMAGHDLRQPLQVIHNTYKRTTGFSSNEAERIRLARGERAVAQLTRQLDRLVGALRLYEETRNLELVTVPVGPLLWRLLSENEDAAREKGIDLRVCPTRAAISSHPALLDSILSNFVRNAIQYTEPGGRILIGCRRRGGDLRIDVHDTGVGIAPQYLPRIFQAFTRLDSNSPDGLGIGLFVVRRAVELLGHRIDVTSTPGKGSRFSIHAQLAG